MKAPSPGKEEGSPPDTDKEELMAVLCERTKNEGLSERNEVQRGVMEKEAEMNDGNQQDTTNTPEHDIQQTTVLFEELQVKQNREEGNVSTEMGPQERMAHVDQKPAEDVTPETVCSLEEQMARQSIEESKPPVEATAVEVECWDEYKVSNVDATGANSLSFVLASLLSESETLCEDGSLQHEPTAWHFPAGPGLADELQCPLWQFPTMSYYPPLEQPVPFEGESLD